jgi:hypothetical protein
MRRRGRPFFNPDLFPAEKFLFFFEIPTHAHLASEAVEWFRKYFTLGDTGAVKWGKTLAQKGAIKHVLGKNPPFTDSREQYWRFTGPVKREKSVCPPSTPSTLPLLPSSSPSTLPTLPFHPDQS